MTEDDPLTLTDAKRRARHCRYNAKRYLRDPAAAKARVLAWARNNPEKRKAVQRRWREENRIKTRALRLAKNYDIDLASWNSLFLSQESKCAICRCDQPGAKSGWHTDHLHGTKIVRGILCHNCNAMLGHALDNPATLIEAAAYLERTRNGGHEETPGRC